ncbi:L-lactate permease [Gordonibacter sp. An230]|uniref:L-lactate permease n=1 Tax=Gordonibacter sp. An230 TaxID=1965592 RepID=UPI000B39CEDE|nr:L-lactate permease [Gordonibacter sp. An230]OUO88902.1 L-lactate permease [Gordonibacter sp. An230]
MFQATVDPVGGSLALSALTACAPLATFFVMLAGFKLKAHVSALGALVASLLVGILAFRMPIDLALLSALQGAAYGAFPIVFIIVAAVWFYEITVVSKRFNDLRSFFDIVGGGDIRIQAVLVAFCFGALLEALAGFGAPIAITATMVLALGVKPVRAALVVLIANTAPVAYGAVATPITTAGSMVAGGDASVAAETAEHVAAIVGVQAPLFALVVPLLVCVVLDGRKGVRDCWPAALVIGASFALTQWWCSNHFAYELTDVIASLVSLGAAVVFMRVWKAKGADEARERMGAPAGSSDAAGKLSLSRGWMALLPYVVVTAVFAIGKLGIPDVLAATDIKIPWPGLAGNVTNALGADPGTTYTFNWLSNPGTMLVVAGLIVGLIYSVFDGGGAYKVTMGTVVRELFRTAWKMRLSCLTIVLVLSLAYVMNFSGQTIAIGQLLAGTGVFFALLSPVLGWVGTAVTGSDTSANALFASLQHTAAQANPSLAATSPDLFLASNTMGGVMGKMISPQSLAIAAVATGEHESSLFKKVLPWSLGLLACMCLLVFLQSGLLSFMIPG